MGAALSCFQARDEDDDRRPNLCLCFTFAVDPVFRVWTTLVQRVHPAPHPQLFVGHGVVDDSSCDTYRPPPRPLSFDDPRCSYTRSGSWTSSNKASSHVCVEAELNRNSDESDVEPFNVGNKCKDSDSVPFLKQAPRELEYGLLYAFTFPEEDSCPICLEEYISENPKMTLHCMHHFHLACIYEWMERSEACPICGKVMELDEKT